MASCSWQNTFTTFCPVIISSTKALTSASDCCCVLKWARLHLPSRVVAITMRAAMSMDTMVSGTLSTIIEVKVATMVTTDEKSWAMAVDMSWRRESTSLV